MDFAADAVLDVVAPPQRASGAKSAPATEPDAPTFDDHLAAATQEDAPVETQAAPAAAEGAHASADAPPTDNAAETAAPAPVAAQPATQPEPSLPVLVQLIASEAPTPEQTNAAPATQAQTPPGPVAATPQTNARVATPAQTPPATSGEAPGQSAPQMQAETAAPTPPASAQRDNGAQQAAPQQQAQTATPVAATPVAQVPATAPSPALTAEVAAQTAAPSANATTVVPQTSATREAAMPRSGKSNAAQGDEKFEVVSRDPRAAPAPNAGVKQGPKTQPGPSATKETTTIATATTTDASTPLPQTTSASAAASTTTQAATHTQQVVAADHGAARAPAGYQVGREIIRQFDGDSTRFELRLDPPELGRVEVKLEVSRDHRVTAVIAADSPQALTELARNARELEQMLQSAGLELSDSGLSFDLRQGDEGAQAQENDGSRGDAQSETALEQITPQARPLGYERWRGVRVDVMV